SKDKESGMFQKFIYNAYGFNIFANAFNSGNQAANASYYNFYFYSGTTGFVEFINHLLVRNAVCFGFFLALFSFFYFFNFFLVSFINCFFGEVWEVIIVFLALF